LEGEEIACPPKKGVRKKDGGGKFSSGLKQDLEELHSRRQRENIRQKKGKKGRLCKLWGHQRRGRVTCPGKKIGSFLALKERKKPARHPYGFVETLLFSAKTEKGRPTRRIGKKKRSF